MYLSQFNWQLINVVLIQIVPTINKQTKISDFELTIITAHYSI